MGREKVVRKPKSFEKPLCLARLDLPFKEYGLKQTIHLLGISVLSFVLTELLISTAFRVIVVTR